MTVAKGQAMTGCPVNMDTLRKVRAYVDTVTRAISYIR